MAGESFVKNIPNLIANIVIEMFSTLFNIY